MKSEIRRKQVQLHNQDLDIIIANEPKEIWDKEDGDFYLLFVPEKWDEVIAAAIRMAIINQGLVKDLAKVEEDKEYNANLYKEKDKEIDRLRDELSINDDFIRAKRFEVDALLKELDRLKEQNNKATDALLRKGKRMVEYKEEIARLNKEIKK